MTIETPAGTVDVRAAEARGPEHADDWKQITDTAPGLAAYEQRAGRTIPGGQAQPALNRTTRAVRVR